MTFAISETGGLNAARLMAAALVSVFPAIGAVAADREMESVTVRDIRGMRYCEFLLVFEDRVDVYNTTASNGCPDEAWQAMDTAAIAAEFGAGKVQLNGPKFWAADDQTLVLGET